MSGIHTEKTFEAEIEAHLLAHGYESASSSDFDRDKALFPKLVIEFVRTTQPKAWAKLKTILKDKLDALFIKEVCKVMKNRGSLEVLRHGFTFYSKKVRLAFFKPGHRKNPDLWALYGKNRLSVVRQLRYDPNNDNELDLVLCVNGIPVVTCELKNAMTGQKAGHAKQQYRNDRDPKAPIFVFKQRALVHFAVDADEAWMTTQLEKRATRFLPFNRGDHHGAGNPTPSGDDSGKHRTFYLWERVWERESLLDIVGRFMHLEEKSSVDPNTGKKEPKEKMIFPRYHQLDCVRQLEAKSRLHGAGTNYLVQHSAGSGKSNSIAWLAHRLASLHDEDDHKVYHSVVVLTDRRVLDQQLQNTIYQFDHKDGVVEKIDKHSKQLATALATGTPIIISTIHKFGFIQDKVGALPDRRYAIIVDEAHSSQSGEMAVDVKAMLADSTLKDKLTEQQIEEELSTPDQLALRKALQRGPQPNMSFFAFTATPKHKTLEMFGHKDKSGKPAPFHLYSMRQAIEEKFILDVLLGYTTYKRFFKLAKAIADDPKLDKRKASSALARFVNLHPTNIAQKTEIIIEHFRTTVAHQLEGKAKAMVVTGSRLQAVKYKLSFDGYIEKKGYADIRCLVAFSGEVTDDKSPTVKYTEVGMNDGIKEGELPEKFASDAYQVLLVANKYQTGFDQPLLSAMYVDKRLSGIQAVQTLSRLNRMERGKTTFVLDFVNEREDILASFQDYYETTTTDDEVDPQRFYDLQHELAEAKVFTESEVNGFAEVFYQLPGHVNPSSHGKLNGWLDPAVDRFKALGVDDDERVEVQEAFRGRLVAFKNLYAFLAQIVPFQDPDLEKLYAFGRMLLRKLPRPETGGPLDLDDDVILASLKLKKEAEGDLDLEKGSGGELRGPGATGTGAAKPPKELLSTIIDALNQRFGLDLPSHINEFLGGVSDALVDADEVRLGAEANDKANFAHIFNPALEDTMAEHHEDNTDFVDLFFKDGELRKFLSTRLLNDVYDRIRVKEEGGDETVWLPYERVPPEEVRPFVNAVPVYPDLKVAAGRFSGAQAVQEVPQHEEVTDPAAFEWAALEGRIKPSPGLFVARVVGESMNRRIPNGAWCVWRLNPTGSRQGKVVLAQHNDIQDADLGSYTVKLYDSEKESVEGGGWRHRRITLKPESSDPSFQAIVLEDVEEGELKIVAELVEVLG